MKFLKSSWRVLLWVIVICIGCLSSRSNSYNLPLFHNFDKLVHFLLYFIFTFFLLDVFIRYHKKLTPKVYLITFLITFFCGLFIEFIQPYVGRSCDVSDIAANAAGILAGMVLFLSLHHFLKATFKFYK